MLVRALVLAFVLLLPSLVGDFYSAGISTSSSETSVTIPSAINPVNPEAIPLGDGNLSTSPKVGDLYSCQTSFPGGGGAQTIEPWVDEAAKTWNSTGKITVSGNVSWPNAYFTVEISGTNRIISGNDLPINHGTGVFPISPTDPAYNYDRNPNHIEAHPFTLTLPATPSLAKTISCVPQGVIGVLTDGVFLYDALDGEGRDAAAHELLDFCGGHPDPSDIYHHHEVPSCLMQNFGPNSSTLVGYAIDGFGIYVEKDSNGNLLTNANLDACHGRASEVMWNGQLTMIYHYDATLEYPYTLGCFMGMPVPTQFTGPLSASQQNSATSGGVLPDLGVVLVVIIVVAASAYFLSRRRAIPR